MKHDAVLVVEDDATLARVITRNLTIRGYVADSVLTVADAVGAIGVRCPDLVVLDIDLPDGSGWDVARELRAHEQSVTIVVISALRPNHKLLTEFGCEGFLEKPFPMDALVRAVETSLDSDEAEAR